MHRFLVMGDKNHSLSFSLESLQKDLQRSLHSHGRDFLQAHWQESVRKASAPVSQ